MKPGKLSPEIRDIYFLKKKKGELIKYNYQCVEQVFLIMQRFNLFYFHKYSLFLYFIQAQNKFEDQCLTTLFMKTVSLDHHIWIQQFASCPRRLTTHLPYVTFLMSKQCDLEVKKQKQSRGKVEKLVSQSYRGSQRRNRRDWKGWRWL